MLKPLTMWITTNCGKFLKRWDTRPPYLLPEKSVYRFSSVQSLSCFWLFATLWGLQGLPVNHQLQIYPHSCPSCRWCHSTISSSVVPFSSCLQSFPASRSFKWVSPSHQVAKVLEFQLFSISPSMNTQDWSPLGWTSWISLQSKGLSRVLSNTTVQKYQFFGNQLSL